MFLPHLPRNIFCCQMSELNQQSAIHLLLPINLFEEKQFGTFGEAAIVSIIADASQKDKVFDALYELCELDGHQSGLVFMTPEIIKSTLDPK